MPRLSLLAIAMAAVMSLAPHAQAEVKTAPYGAWTSPISAQSLAASEVRLDDLRVANGKLYWIESRPRRAKRASGRCCGHRQSLEDVPDRTGSDRR